MKFYLTMTTQNIIDVLNDFFFYEHAFHNEDYERFGDALFVISCEHIPDDIQKTRIHYDLNCDGSDEINDLLRRFDLEFEWFEPNLGVIHDKLSKKDILY